MKCFEYGAETISTILHFLCNIQMGPISACYITLYRKVLPWTNSQAYWVYSQVTENMKCFEYEAGDHIQNTSFSSISS
jgi:hypothetical protein